MNYQISRKLSRNNMAAATADNNNTTVSSPPKKQRMNERDMDRGWAWVVLFSTFSSCLVFGGQQYGFANYFVVFLQYFGESRSFTSWAGGLQAAIFHLTGPLSSILLPRIGSRAVTMLGGLLMAVGFGLLFLAQSMLYIIVVYGILVGIGSCLVLSGSQASTTAYFSKHLFIATGVAFSGVGVGFLTLGLMSEYIIEFFGWRSSMFIQCGVCLQVFVFSALVFKRIEVPKEKSVQNCSVTEVPPAMQKVNGTAGALTGGIPTAKTPTIKEYFQDGRFWCLNFATLLVNMGGTSVLIYFKDMLIQKNLYIYDIVLIALGSGSTLGRFSAGFIAKQVNPMLFYFIVATANATNIMSFSMVNNQTGFLIAGFIFGYGHGCCSILQSLKLINVYGRTETPKLWGYGMAYGSLGVLVGPPVFGYIKDNTGRFTGSLLLCSTCIIVAGLFALAVYLVQLKRRQNRLAPYLPPALEPDKLTGIAAIKITPIPDV